MAIFHLSTKAVSRGSGRTATAAAAYRAGEKIKDERTGKTHDYTNKKGIMQSSAFVVQHGQIINVERQTLWNVAEQSEKRKDARTAREIIVNLPHELSEEQRTKLVDDFAINIAKKLGVAIDYAIHTPNEKGDDRNHHAHILMTTRKAKLENGTLTLGAKSDLELDNKTLKERGLKTTQNQITDIRKTWADLTNEYLLKNNISVRIDHRSHKERGINQIPTKKMGVSATALERKGIATQIGEINRTIQKENQILRIQDAKNLALEKAKLKYEKQHQESPNNEKVLSAYEKYEKWKQQQEIASTNVETKNTERQKQKDDYDFSMR